MIATISSPDCNTFEHKLTFNYQEGWDILSCGFSNNIWWAILQNDKEYEFPTELYGEEE